MQIISFSISVVDSIWFDSDPDPTFHFDSDPDPDSRYKKKPVGELRFTVHCGERKREKNISYVVISRKSNLFMTSLCPALSIHWFRDIKYKSICLQYMCTLFLCLRVEPVYPVVISPSGWQIWVPWFFKGWRSTYSRTVDVTKRRNKKC